MTTLIHDKCRLRPVSRADLQTSLAWRNDPELRGMVMGYRFPVTEPMEAAWYDRALADQGVSRANFAIEDAADGAFAGFVHLNDIDWQCRSAEIGILIGLKDRQGKGLGRQAAELALVYAFQTLNLSRITARHLASNSASDRLFVSLGFRNEGRLRKAGYLNGLFDDIVISGLLREDSPLGAASAQGSAE
jgi:RimJ/RimL family protein N-acetyltransferase